MMTTNNNHPPVPHRAQQQQQQQQDQTLQLSQPPEAGTRRPQPPGEEDDLDPLPPRPREEIPRVTGTKWDTAQQHAPEESEPDTTHLDAAAASSTVLLSLQKLIGKDDFESDKFQRIITENNHLHHHNNNTDASGSTADGLDDDDDHFTPLDHLHLHQVETWDCGVTCILIILRWIAWLKKDHDDNDPTRSHQQEEEEEVMILTQQHRRSLLKMMGTQSIWTADLVLALDNLFCMEQEMETQRNHRHGDAPRSPKYLFCSKTFQVQEEYRHLGYYQAAFGNDQTRVNAIFQQFQTRQQQQQQQKQRHHPQPMPAANTMELVPKEGMPFAMMLNAVCHSHCIAILLIDNNIFLQHEEEEEEGPILDSYVGHYVIVCGISRDPIKVQEARKREYRDNGDNDAIASLDARNETAPRSSNYCVVLCNPGQYQPCQSFCMPSRLERAWKAKGTDEDVIFVYYRPR